VEILHPLSGSCIADGSAAKRCKAECIVTESLEEVEDSVMNILAARTPAAMRGSRTPATAEEFVAALRKDSGPTACLFRCLNAQKLLAYAGEA
jgi:uncharacterized protein CbrC (UPF0167 family)